jgi:hypothetical protein
MLWVVAVGPVCGGSDALASAAVLAARVLQVLGSLPVVSVAAGAAVRWWRSPVRGAEEVGVFLATRASPGARRRPSPRGSVG